LSSADGFLINYAMAGVRTFTEEERGTGLDSWLWQDTF